MKITWPKKSSTYVACLNCLSSCPGAGACKGLGYTKKRQPTLPTVSERVQKLECKEAQPQTGHRKSLNMEIMFPKLVFTTNKDGINNSVSVAHDQKIGEAPHASSDNLLKDAEPPKRRLSIKNIRGLKLNTGSKLVKSKNNAPDSQCSTAEPLIAETSSVSVKNLAKKFDFDNKRNVNT